MKDQMHSRFVAWSAEMLQPMEASVSALHVENNRCCGYLIFQAS